MNELKDNGLKKALKVQAEFKLTTNFIFRTMQRVEAEALRLEKKRERITILSIVIASILLIIGGGITIWIYFGDTFQDMSIEIIPKDLFSLNVPSFYYFIWGCLPLFVCFDRWMRRQYYKRHPEDLFNC